MTVGGSQQLRIFRRAIRDGVEIADAAERAGMSIAEAKMTAAEDIKFPPPEEAYALLNTEGPTMADERQHGMGGGHVAADELRLIIERAERLEEEKKGISDDIKDVFAEAKGRGYDPKAIRKVLALRKKKKEEVQEENAIVALYCDALGMQYALL